MARQGLDNGSIWTTLALVGLAAVGVVRQQQTRDLPVPARPAGTARAPAGRPPLGAGKQAGAAAPPVEHPPGFIGIVKSVFARFSRDNISLVAAGIAFYIMLSLFPALAALVSIYALVGNPADVARRIGEYGGLLPPEALKLITDGLMSFAAKSSSQLSMALVTSVIMALWSARAGVSSIMTGLNIAYEEEERRSFIMQNVIALGLTLAGIVLAAVVVLTVAVVPILMKFLALDSFAAMLLDILRWPLLAVVAAVSLAVIYRFAPCRSHPRWRWISWGSGLATLVWLAGSALFSVYVSRFGSYDATYGSLGAVVVLLLWFWVSAIVLLVGAEVDAELDTRATLEGSPLSGAPPSAGPPTKVSRA